MIYTIYDITRGFHRGLPKFIFRNSSCSSHSIRCGDLGTTITESFWPVIGSLVNSGALLVIKGVIGNSDSTTCSTSEIDLMASSRNIVTVIKAISSSGVRKTAIIRSVLIMLLLTISIRYTNRYSNEFGDNTGSILYDFLDN